MEHDQWLVRTAGSNEILGPFAKENLLAQIRAGKYGPSDEVCRANHFWFYLEEKEEVALQLGIESPRESLNDDEEEITETQTQLMEGDEDETPAEGIPSLSEPVTEEDMTRMTNRALRRLDPRKPRFDRKNFKSQEVKPFVIGMGKVEKSSIWRIILTVLMVIAGLLVAWVVRLLQTAG